MNNAQLSTTKEVEFMIEFESGKKNIHVVLKDARSVSLYPYNRSKLLQYVTYTL